jgi:hypothetical protein
VSAVPHKRQTAFSVIKVDDQSGHIVYRTTGNQPGWTHTGNNSCFYNQTQSYSSGQYADCEFLPYSHVTRLSTHARPVSYNFTQYNITSLSIWGGGNFSVSLAPLEPSGNSTALGMGKCVVYTLLCMISSADSLLLSGYAAINSQRGSQLLFHYKGDLLGDTTNRVLYVTNSGSDNDYVLDFDFLQFHAQGAVLPSPTTTVFMPTATGCPYDSE